MKTKKGYLPRISGRPGSGISTCELVSPLQIPLCVAGMQYTAVVKTGDSVAAGEPLAELETAGGSLTLPAPYTGKVESVDEDGGLLGFNVADPNPQAWSKPTFTDPTTLNFEKARELLAAAGIWPGIWDSASRAVPSLDAEAPKAIVVKAVITEPFRARGNVILETDLDLFFQGLAYLERLSGEFAPTYLILTAVQHPLAQKIKTAVAGLAWVKPVFVPLTYPAGNSQYIWRNLKQSEKKFGVKDSIWFFDLQSVMDIARCLAQGLVPSRRIISLGGPGYEQGQHVVAPIGTPLAKLCSDLDGFDGRRVIRGGLFSGNQVDPKTATVGHLDDGFTFLPEGTEREFLSFMRLGLDRPSYTPNYLSFFRSSKALSTTTSIRGERRACIACGYCEEICPVDIMPHLIWRFVQKDLLEEAQAAGAQICVECGLCSYVCPSKIELMESISKGIKQIQEELIIEDQTQEVSS